MGFWSDLVKKGPGWDVHDVYDWVPGVESGEEKGRMEALKRGYENVPAPPGITPETRGYMDRLQELSGQELGAGWETSPYYKALMGQVQEQLRQSGYAIGAQHARQGATYYGQGGPGNQQGPMYGAALKGSTEQQLALQQGTQQAAGQAYQYEVQRQVQEFQNLLAAAGFASDIYSQDWEQRFRYAAQQLGWPEAQIQAGVERQRQIMGLGGQVAQAAGIYYGLGGGGGKGVGGSGPGGGSTGFLPGSVG